MDFAITDTHVFHSTLKRICMNLVIFVSFSIAHLQIMLWQLDGQK